MLGESSPETPSESTRPEPPAPSRAGALPSFDENRLAQAGIRKIVGEHLTLYTDLPSAPAIEELPKVFDQAVLQWCDYFGIDRREVAGWRITGSLMNDKARFAATGLLPPSLPDFENGYQLGWQLWCYEKPSDYYRRHLLLHEGVHALMNHFLGGAGPPWYMEGMAEMLALHRWQDGRLTVGILPPANQEVWLWGRIKIIREDVAHGKWMPLSRVFQYGPTAHRQVSAYAYAWAACLFLSHHPRYRTAFKKLKTRVQDASAFVEAVSTSFPSDNGELAEDWQVFLQEVDYQLDFEATIVRRDPGNSLNRDRSSYLLDPRAGWQSTGIFVEAGKTYRVQSRGMLRIRPGDPDWTTEADGITIHYYRRRPLGMLLYAVRPVSLSSESLSPLLDPRPLGSQAVLKPAHDGILYVRINEPARELHDNDGKMEVHVERGATSLPQASSS